MSYSLQPPGLHHARLLCPSTPGACSNSSPSHWWCHPIISSSVIPFSFLLQSFPASGPFPMIQFLASGSQSTGVLASASVLPMNIQDWFPLRSTGLISLLFETLSIVFTPQFERISSLALSLLYGPTLTFAHDYWKNHSSDNTDLCQQSDVFAS